MHYYLGTIMDILFRHKNICTQSEQSLGIGNVELHYSLDLTIVDTRYFFDISIGVYFFI